MLLEDLVSIILFPSCGKTDPLEVPVYVSVQLAPLGQTFPVKVHAVRSVDVRISIPGAVASC